MKRFLMIITLVMLILTFSGCSFPLFENEPVEPPTPDDFEPAFYTHEEELPENSYFIARDVTEYETDKDGNTIEINYTKYFPILAAEKTYEEKRDTYAGYDFSRVVWVNYNIDEGLIPTMYSTDRLIYKSSTYIPTKYAMEKFFDNGYTLGVCGLEQDLSQNYRYISVSSEKSGKGCVLTTSDAVGFEGLEAESIYLVQVGDKRIAPDCVSMSGTVTGLTLMDLYDCDIRTGTERILAQLRCNVHYFSSAETYMFGTFTFITPIIAEINIPDYVSNGYYEINDAGLFRYMAKDNVTDWKTVPTEDLNNTIYTYNSENKVVGTTIGLVFDENGFLREPLMTDHIDSSNVDPVDTQTFEQLLDVLLNGIEVTHPTMLTPDSGYYFDNFTVDVITSKMVKSNYTLYEFQASSDTETLDFYYKARYSDETPKVGETYQIVFKDPTIGSIKSYVVSTLNKARTSED